MRPAGLCDRIGEVAGKVWFKLQVFFLEGLLRPERPAGMLRLGTYYGGWWIPEVAPTRGVALCVGAGTDVTFDLELQRLGYAVYTVDPTPAAVEHVREHAPSLELLPVGVWTTTGELQFMQDAVWDESWMIGDTVPAGTATSAGASFPVMSLDDLVASTGHSDVDVLKLDIEGAEHRVLATMLASDLRPWTVAVEFDDHRVGPVVASTKAMRRAGYRLLQIEGRNYIFTRV